MPGLVSVSALLSSIPSPSRSVIDIGPLPLRMYGLCIALGVIAAVWLAQKRYAARGHDPEDVATMAMWAVPAGVVGGRLYHVITDNQRFRGNWGDAFRIWEGGLGVWGAVAGGAIAGLYIARARNMHVADLFDAAAPAVPLAQAIGRLGNYFNQELFGRPSDLPWALEIDPSHRPAGFEDSATFHPTFLYESLWNLAVVGLLIWVVPRVMPNLRRGYLFGVYVVMYTLGRLWIEIIRIDTANKILGVRLNVWTSIIVGLIAAAFVVHGRSNSPDDATIGDDLMSAPSREEV